MSRTTLRQVLRTGLEDVAHFDKEFARYESQPGGVVTAIFEDRSTAKGDILVAADGAGSRVCKQFGPHAALEETGILGIGSEVSLTADTERLLSPKVLHGVSMVMASKGCGAILHVVESPGIVAASRRRSVATTPASSRAGPACRTTTRAIPS